MYIYITMNIYDNSEFYIWDIAKTKTEAVQKFKEEHLPFFFTGAQPDISILDLRRVNISKEDYIFLQEYLNKDKTDIYAEERVTNLLKSFYENKEDDFIYNYQGDDVLEVAEYYAVKTGIELPDDERDEIIEEVFWELNEDEELLNRMIKEYIEENFV